MSYLINNQQKLNELVFANRNKNYGAYAIRSSYGQTMLKSLSCVIFGLGATMSIAYYIAKRPVAPEIKPEQIIDKIYTLPVDLEKKTKPQIPEPSKPSKTQPSTKPASASADVVVNDSLANDTHTTLNQAVQNPGDLVSTSAGSGTETGTDGSTGGSTKGTDALTSGIKGNFEVDSQPEFEGGLAALYRFISSQLRYPGRALDEGVQGTVFVKFVVDEKGKVGSLSLMNNLGYGLDDEARRVVSIIPDFKTPAKVKGTPVKVYYQIPIKFKYR